MTQGDPDYPAARADRGAHMDKETNSNKERGEKRGVLSTGRARKLEQDADADATDDEE